MSEEQRYLKYHKQARGVTGSMVEYFRMLLNLRRYLYVVGDDFANFGNTRISGSSIPVERSGTKDQMHRPREDCDLIYCIANGNG